jgi:hypothetical protein
VAVNPERPGESVVILETGVPRLFSEIGPDGRKTYTDAGVIDGVTVFGRGVRIPMLVTNVSSGPAQLLRLEVLTNCYIKYQPELRYDKIMVSIPHPRLPFDGERGRVRLMERDMNEGTVAVRGTHRVLHPGGGRLSGGQFEITIEAAVSGLWACHVQARFLSAGRTETSEQAGPFFVLLRGK